MTNNYFKILLISLITGVCIILLSIDTYSQCAMCRAVAKSNVDGGGSAALGINHAILYLLAAPYILLAVGGFFWYKSSVRKQKTVNN